MEWEITITTESPEVLQSLMQMNIPALKHNDIKYFVVKAID